MSYRGTTPDWLYRILPYLYVGAGLLTMLNLQNGIGLFSGLLLVSAGIIVWTLRMKHRSNRGYRRMPAPAGVLDEPALNHPAGFVRLVWRQDYECGHPLIDAQHRRLFESGNALLNEILKDHDKLDVELMLDELIAHVEQHFSDEEALLAHVQRPIGPEHQAVHRQLLARARLLSERFHRGELAVGDLFAFIAHDVVAQHIIKEDRQFLDGLQGAGPR